MLFHLYRKQPNETFPPASYTALSRIQHLVAVSSYQPLRQISTPYPSNNGFNKQAFSEYSYTHPSPTQRAKAPTNTDQFRFEAKTPPKRQSFTHTPKSFSHSANFHILHPSFRLHLQTCSPVLSPHSMSRQKHTMHKFFTSLLQIHVFTLFYLYRKQPNEISKLTHHSINKSLLTIPLLSRILHLGNHLSPPLKEYCFTRHGQITPTLQYPDTLTKSTLLIYPNY